MTTRKRLIEVGVMALLMAAGSAGLSASARAADVEVPPTANPDPSAAERAGAKVGNEVDMAVGPTKPITKAELASGISLSKVPDPERALSTAQIKNPAGEAVGVVSSVDVAPDGKARAVHANVGGFLGMGERTVALDADKLVYVKSRDLLVTKLTKEQIEALPPVSDPHG